MLIQCRQGRGMIKMSLELFIKEAIEKEIEQLATDAIKRAQKEIEINIAEIVSKISLYVLEQVSFERMGRDLIIHRRKK